MRLALYAVLTMLAHAYDAPHAALARRRALRATGLFGCWLAHAQAPPAFAALSDYKTELFVEHPDLMADLELERLLRFTTPGGTWDELLTTNFFVGSKNVRSAIHTAYGGNFFINLVGRKRWRFISPKYSAYLHPVGARPFDYATSALGSLYAAEQEGRDDAIFFRLPVEEVVLEPGDMLYSAPWWWHEVDNCSAINIATAVRHMQPPGALSPSLTNSLPLALASRFPKSRFLTTIHYLKHRMGGEASLRERVNRAVWERVQSSLDQRQAQPETPQWEAQPSSAK